MSSVNSGATSLLRAGCSAPAREKPNSWKTINRGKEAKLSKGYCKWPEERTKAHNSPAIAPWAEQGQTVWDLSPPRKGWWEHDLPVCVEVTIPTARAAGASYDGIRQHAAKRKLQNAPALSSAREFSGVRRGRLGCRGKRQPWTRQRKGFIQNGVEPMARIAKGNMLCYLKLFIRFKKQSLLKALETQSFLMWNFSIKKYIY